MQQSVQLARYSKHHDKRHASALFNRSRSVSVERSAARAIPLEEKRLSRSVASARSARSRPLIKVAFTSSYRVSGNAQSRSRIHYTAVIRRATARENVHPMQILSGQCERDLLLGTQNLVYYIARSRNFLSQDESIYNTYMGKIL